MKKLRRKPAEETPARDPRVVAIVRATAGGLEACAFRSEGRTVQPVADARFGPGDGRMDAWLAECRAARAVVVLPGSDVIVRSVQLPSADEDRLEGALRLNASTFVLGRTPSWRTACAMLPRERGDGVRTGIVVEWPEDGAAPGPQPPIGPGTAVSCAPTVAALAALAGAANGPLVWVDAAHGVVSMCVPTSKGLLVRTLRAGAAGEAIAPQEVALAIGEACVHASVPGSEIPPTIERTVAAAAPALGGGLGCLPDDVAALAALVRGAPGSGDAGWWKEHGLDVGLAVAASGTLAPLTSLQAQDPGAAPDRAAAFLNRLAEPRMARKLLVAGLAAVLLGPLVIEGARLLLLRWKLPDLDAYVKAEDDDRRKQAMYRALSRQGTSMTKTLSDLASCAPDGIEIEFINVAAAARGQAVTVRGKARAAGSMPATEVMLEMERQLRESGAFEGIQRSSEAPDSRGYQEFTINTVAVRPTYMVAFPEAQDFDRKSMRVRRYGPPPEDVDPAASGIDPRDAQPPKDADDADAGGKRTEPQRAAAKPNAGAPEADAGRRPAAVATEESNLAVDGAAAAQAAAPAEPAAGDTEPKSAAAGGRPTRGSSGGGRSGLATRSNPGAANEPEPLPPPLSDNEISRMSVEEARDMLTSVSRARGRADISEEDKARLKREFDKLLDQCKPK